MELFFVIGFVAIIGLMALGGLTFLRQRRMGTLMVISAPRIETRSRSSAGRTSSAHR
jgi:hypothetical protein